MREYIDDEGIRHTDPLCFDEFGMIDRGVKAIKLLYGITGAVGLIAGLALLFSPIKTLMVLATILGIYFIVASVVRIGVAIGTPFMPTGWRALNILSSLLILFCGVIRVTRRALMATAHPRRPFSESIHEAANPALPFIEPIRRATAPMRVTFAYIDVFQLRRFPSTHRPLGAGVSISLQLGRITSVQYLTSVDWSEHEGIHRRRRNPARRPALL